MRYKVIVRRVQIAERHVRAADEEAAVQKVQAELHRPFGFLGEWRTIDTDLEIVEAESPLSTSPGQVESSGPALLSVKDAAAHLGLPPRVVYQLINDGELGHLRLGSRRYISREQLSTFIEGHSRQGR